MEALTDSLIDQRDKPDQAFSHAKKTERSNTHQIYDKLTQLETLNVIHF